jgi:hypothetical protein
MTLGAEQVQRIQRLEPGWRDAWGRLVEELLPLMERRLRRMFPGAAAEALEEVRERVLLEYQKSAESGRILANFGPECGDPARWLLGAAFAGKARGHLKDLGREKRHATYVDAAGPPGPGGGPRPDPVSALHDLAFRFPRRGITKPVLYAGLQLFPKLDPAAPAMQDFVRGLLALIRTNVGAETDDAARAWLLARHAERRAEFEDRLAKMHEKRDRDRFQSPVSLERLERKMTRTEIEMALFPLAPDAIARALGIERNYSDRIRNAYRNGDFLRALLPRLDESFRGAGPEDEGGPDALECDPGDPGEGGDEP